MRPGLLVVLGFLVGCSAQSASRGGVGWETQDVEMDKPPASKPIVHSRGAHGMYEIRSQTELRALGLTNEPWVVDFQTERLIVKNSDLYSHATARALIDDTTYYLFQSSDRELLVGNAYTQPGLLWMVVPRDGRMIRFGRNQQALGCETCRAGALVTLRRIQIDVAAT